MTKLYTFGKDAALKDLGLLKEAANLGSFANGTFMRSLGAAGKAAPGAASEIASNVAGRVPPGLLGRMGGHAAMGAGMGGVAGAAGADEGHRGSGFMRGALAGGAIGAVGGAGNHMMQAPGSNMSTQLGVPMQSLLRRGSIGTGALAVGGGYLAGGTAQASPWERIKRHIPGLG